MNKKIASEIAVGIILLVTIIIGGIFWLNNKNNISIMVENIPAINVEKTMSEEELMEKKCLDNRGKIQNYEYNGKIRAYCDIKNGPTCILEDYYNGSCGVGLKTSNLTPGDCGSYTALLKKYGSVKNEIISANGLMNEFFITGELCQVSVKFEGNNVLSRLDFVDSMKQQKLKEGWTKIYDSSGVTSEGCGLAKDDKFLEIAGYTQPVKGAKIVENCNQPMCYESYDEYILISSGVGYVERYN